MIAPLPLLILYLVFLNAEPGLPQEVADHVNKTLQHMLCGPNSTLDSDTTIDLLPGVTYIIESGSICMTENLTRLTIQGISSENLAIIQCRLQAAEQELESSSLPTRGFGFFNVTNLTMKNVVVEHCGGVFPPESLKHVADSFFKLGGPGEQLGVFLLSHCSNVLFENVVIRDYTGYAVVAANVIPSLKLKAVNIENSTYYGTGLYCGLCESGVVIYYKDSTPTLSSFPEIPNTLVSISETVFSKNYNYLPLDQSVVNALMNPDAEGLGITGGAALILLFRQRHYTVDVNISNSRFTDNFGTLAAAALILYVNLLDTAHVSFTKCVTSSFNVLPSGLPDTAGTHIAMYVKNDGNYAKSDTTECLRIQESNFVIGFRGVLLVIAGSCRIKMEDCNCTTAACLDAKALDANSRVEILIRDISAIQDTEGTIDAILKFFNIMSVTIAGISEFDSHTPIIVASASNLYLTGLVHFQSGQAQYGGALLLRDDSHLLLQEPLYAVFENNQATFGGAIYVVGSSDEVCSLQYITSSVYTLSNVSSINISLTFSNNSAKLAGNSVFAYPLYGCDLFSNVNIQRDELSELYNYTFHFPTPSLNTLREVSSLPDNICICEPSFANSYPFVPRCKNETPIYVNAYPGKDFSFYMVPIDGSGSPVYSAMITTITPKYKREESEFDWTLGIGQDIVQLYGENCTKVNFTIYSKVPEITVGNLYGQPLNLRVGGKSPSTYIVVSLFDCPPGFQRNDDGGCGCSSLFEKHDITCDVNTFNITRPPNSWLGIIDGDSDSSEVRPVVGFASTCPSDYCVNSVQWVNISKKDSLCNGNRARVLCGACKEGLSAVFGTGDCMQCSNAWLWTTVLYIIAGILLVLLLFGLRITVADGTLNGLIFYANVLNVTTSFFLGHVGLEWLSIFISFVNLNLGFPLCFYHEMSTNTKYYLQYAFPLYLWTIVAIIIILCRYFSNSKLARMASKSSTPVLATLFYLSYSKLLSSAIDALVFETVEMQDGNNTLSQKTVWYFDGNVDYLSGAHIGLFGLALITLVFFLTPYTIILAGIPFFRRCRLVNYFKPLIDAYCGPYKDKWHFWFGARLCVLMGILALNAILRGNDTQLLFFIETLVLTLFTLAQVAIKPFKNKLVNLLDVFFLTNLIILDICAIYLTSSYGPLSLHIAAGFLVGTVFIIFLCILLYHLLLVLKCQFRIPWKREQDAYETIQEGSETGNVFRGHLQLRYHPERLREPVMEFVAD